MASAPPTLRAVVDKVRGIGGECRPTAWVETLERRLGDKGRGIRGVCRPLPLGELLALRADIQFGVVARWQLVLLGYGDDSIQRRLTSGRLIPLHAGVYAV